MHVFRLLAVALTATTTWAAVPQPLEDAIKKLSHDTDRWAYTQTAVQKDGKGKTTSEVVLRFDPSKPYNQQYTPLKIDGKEPTESQVRKYRKMGERIEEAKTAGKPPAQYKSVGELMDLDNAKVAQEDDKTITYEVPLKKEGNTRLPPDKFLVTARVNKQQRVLENVSARLRAPLREKLVLKVSSGEGQINFKPVDTKYAPPVSEIRGNGAGSILFVPIGRSYELKRDEYKRVRPFDDKFDVQIGTLKAIDF
jgi:hypothetical protein